MNIRRVTSLTALLSFLFMLLTSIILYVTPHGRVAYWADWHLWGLSKDQWGALHINVGVLFLLALAIHIYYNWSPIVRYLENRAKALKIFTKEFNLALVLLLVCIAGTYAKIPPFSTLLNISEGIKEAAAVKYGEPPYGHAELSSLKSFVRKMETELEPAMAALKAAGYTVESETQTLREIADRNGITPQQVYLAMSTATAVTSESPGRAALPPTPAPGTGNLTLAEFCGQYHLDPSAIANALQTAKLEAAEEMTLKKIAAANHMSPVDLYDLIRSMIADRPAQ